MEVNKRGYNIGFLYFNQFKKSNHFLQEIELLNTHKLIAYIPKSNIKSREIVSDADINFTRVELLNKIKQLNWNKDS